jgi:hypothetical protein
LIFRDDGVDFRQGEELIYEIPGMEEYAKQWERQDVLDAEAHETEGTEEPRESELDAWLMEKGQYNMRGYGERSERWYDIPLDFLCMKGSRGV